LRTGTEQEKERALAIIRRENWLVNVYVINDPVNADNNGKVKVLRFGRQLHKIIMGAIEGDEAEDFGPRIFDLSPKGCNLRIKVEKQGDYPTYVSSKFSSPKEIEGLDLSAYEKVYNSAFDLETYVTVKSYDELKELLDKHYNGTTHEHSVVEKVDVKVSAPVPEVEAIIASKKVAPKPISKKETTEDDTISDLLKDL
jgi:hypothetical protein